MATLERNPSKPRTAGLRYSVPELVNSQNKRKTAAEPVSELTTNRLARYLGARDGGRLIGFGGIWLMVDEAHITTFAVHPAWRRRHIGERLLAALLELAVRRHAREATLEVRLSNLAARKLYEKYGFRPVGVRPRYYSDDNEDALIMTTEPLEEVALQQVAHLAVLGEDESALFGIEQFVDELVARAPQGHAQAETRERPRPRRASSGRSVSGRPSP